MQKQVEKNDKFEVNYLNKQSSELIKLKKVCLMILDIYELKGKILIKFICKQFKVKKI